MNQSESDAVGHPPEGPVQRQQRRRAPRSAIQKVRVVGINAGCSRNGHDIRQVNLYITNRNTAKNLQASLGIRDLDPTLFYHRRESIPDFPRNRAGTDESVTRRCRDNSVSLGLGYEHCNDRRRVYDDIQTRLPPNLGIVQLSTAMSNGNPESARISCGLSVRRGLFRP